MLLMARTASGKRKAVVRARFGSAASAGGPEAGTIRRAPARQRHECKCLVAASFHHRDGFCPLRPPHARDLPGKSFEDAEEFAPVLLRHAAHDEDGGRGKVRGHRQFGETVGGYLGILEQAQLVLELRQLLGVALGAPGVELCAEFEGIAKSLTADTEPMKIGRLS